MQLDILSNKPCTKLNNTTNSNALSTQNIPTDLTGLTHTNHDVRLATSAVGLRGEFVTKLLFNKWGYQTASPDIPCEYDLVIHKDGQFKKVQCKHKSWYQKRATDRFSYLHAIFGKGAYTDGDFDYLSVVCLPFIWVIPSRHIEMAKASLPIARKLNQTGDIIQDHFPQYRYNMKEVIEI